jgi:hypothetical protein
LELLAGSLHRTAGACRAAAEELAGGPGESR